MINKSPADHMGSAKQRARRLKGFQDSPEHEYRKYLTKTMQAFLGVDNDVLGGLGGVDDLGVVVGGFDQGDDLGGLGT
ncbi:hypothetical protein HKX48_009404 [Thoreauomyces humboldtii]|nr:hypothetical protein HKX48_009404 [Thoreauomyces humboldtii]